MELIDVMLKTAILAVRKAAAHRNDSKVTASQSKGTDRESDVFALPVDLSNYQPVQCLDPDSDDFGKFWYMADYDSPDDPNHPMRPN